MAACGAVVALTVLLVSVAPAGAESMVVQPDGKIVLTGRVEPNFAALGRLNPNGEPDPTFGQDGFVIDRRLPVLKALALQPDGRIVAAGMEGFQLARYLPDGTPDPVFGGGGVAGTVDPEQSAYLIGDDGPQTVLIRPGGEILVGGTREAKVGRWQAPAAIVRLYDSNGAFREVAGEIPPPDHPSLESHLGGLLPGPGASAIGVGSIYESDSPANRGIFLARFLPGSGTAYDPSFGGGRGLVRQAFPTGRYDEIQGRAIARHEDRLLVAGITNRTFLLARFDLEGNLDQGFGNGGFVSPPIEGASGEEGGSRANALSVQQDGRIVLAGATSRWGRWGSGRLHAYECVENCVEPLLTRFTADGQLDPSFGAGGVRRLLTPDGERIEGQAEEVVTLPDGKILVKGKITEGTYEGFVAPFLARLNADGSYDRGFGGDGLVTVSFPCSAGRGVEALRHDGCVPWSHVKLRLGGLARGRPRLSLRVARPSVPWAQIGEVHLQLQKALRPASRFRAKTRVVGLESEASPRFIAPDPVRAKHGRLDFKGLRFARAVEIVFSPGALRLLGNPSRRRALIFRVRVEFVHDNSPRIAAIDDVTFRRHGG
jgi:uncharacterized delta-60 repeat protein